MKRNLSFRNTVLRNEYNRTIISNVLSAFFIKGGALVISLLTMPAYINYFENYTALGLWFTVLSVLTWILTFDLGIGNGLRNKLVYAISNNNRILAKKYISSAYFIIGLLTLGVITITFLFIEELPWNMIFNVPESIVPNDTVNLTIIIIFIGIIIQLFLKLITSILYALQKSALTNLLSLISSILVLSFVMCSNLGGDISTKLIYLALAYILAVNLPLLITTLIIFSTSLKESKPNFKYIERKYIKSVVQLGGFFFLVQVMYMLITTTNEFLISWLVGPEMVVEYQIYNRLFTIFGTIFSLALTPIWSAVTKALVEKNYIWIKKLYFILKIMALIIIFCQFMTIPFLQDIINLWLNQNAIEINFLYAAVFSIYGGMIIWIGVLSAISNGLGELKIQCIFFITGVIIKISISYMLVEMSGSWIGIIIANILALSLFCIIQPMWLRNFLNKKTNGDEMYV